jgi:hypothetical protein
MNRRLVSVALMVGIATALASACSATDSASTASAPVRADSAGSGGESNATGQGAAQQKVDQPGVDRMLVRTATIELASADPAATVDRARDVATKEGGYTGGEDLRRDSATLTLQIPSNEFDRALDELSKLGKVISREQAAEDVTEQVVDLDSRIATQRASVERIRALLAKAGTVDEIVRIESELTTREADLESLERRRQALGGQVAMSTITLRVSKTTAPATPPQEESGGFVAGLSDGWGAFLDAGSVALRVLGAVLPFVVVLAVPGVPVYRWWRRRRLAAAQPSA